MRKNHYESVVIINAALEDDQVNSLITKIEDYLKTNDSQIIEVDKWGRKRLAYPIQKSKSGYYVVFHFIAHSNLITDLERMYRLDENVIRYLTVVLDKKALEHIEKQAQIKEEEASNVEDAPVEAEVKDEKVEQAEETPSEEEEVKNESEA